MSYIFGRSLVCHIPYVHLSCYEGRAVNVQTCVGMRLASGNFGPPSSAQILAQKRELHHYLRCSGESLCLSRNYVFLEAGVILGHVDPGLHVIQVTARTAHFLETQGR